MDIPDVLKPFVEFEEEDGTPIEWCDAECGWSTIDADDGMWLLPNRETGDSFFWTGDNPCHCPRCGAVLGVTASYHKPYRIRFSRVVEALAQYVSPPEDAIERTPSRDVGYQLYQALDGQPFEVCPTFGGHGFNALVPSRDNLEVGSYLSGDELWAALVTALAATEEEE